MSDALYHAAILERARANAHAGRLTAPDRTATVDNPLCGDRVTIDLRVRDGRIAEIAQHVRGCALCQASASLIAEHAVGADRAAVAEGAEAVQDMLHGGHDPAGPWAAFSLFTPVSPHRSRHDCVLLPFAALEKALGQEG